MSETVFWLKEILWCIIVFYVWYKWFRASKKLKEQTNGY